MTWSALVGFWKRSVYLRIAAYALSAAIIVCGVVWSVNALTVDADLQTAIASDPRNAGIKASVRYAYYVDPNEIVFSLDDDNGASCLDLLRVLFNFADASKNKRYDDVVLAYKGDQRFRVPGEYFQQMGEQYSGGQNPIYLIRTLPENVLKLDGSNAFESWTGGWLGVMGKQISDANSFCAQWRSE